MNGLLCYRPPRALRVPFPSADKISVIRYVEALTVALTCCTSDVWSAILRGPQCCDHSCIAFASRWTRVFWPVGHARPVPVRPSRVTSSCSSSSLKLPIGRRQLWRRRARSVAATYASRRNARCPCCRATPTSRCCRAGGAAQSLSSFVRGAHPVTRVHVCFACASRDVAPSFMVHLACVLALLTCILVLDQVHNH